jgi:hypothetical protein
MIAQLYTTEVPSDPADAVALAARAADELAQRIAAAAEACVTGSSLLACFAPFLAALANNGSSTTTAPTSSDHTTAAAAAVAERQPPPAALRAAALLALGEYLRLSPVLEQQHLNSVMSAALDSGAPVVVRLVVTPTYRYRMSFMIALCHSAKV